MGLSAFRLILNKIKCINYTKMMKSSSVHLKEKYEIFIKN